MDYTAFFFWFVPKCLCNPRNPRLYGLAQQRVIP